MERHNVRFPYFADPNNFAYLHEGPAECHFCNAVGVALDATVFYGETEIEAVCFDCMGQGRLQDLGISTNEIDAGALTGIAEEVEQIVVAIAHCTPQIPSWQEMVWPVRNGQPYRFLKIASQLDYGREDGKRIFIESLFDCGDEEDVDWLWTMLPKHPVRNLEEGQYDLSFYLFDRDGDLLTCWDAN